MYSDLMSNNRPTPEEMVRGLLEHSNSVLNRDSPNCAWALECIQLAGSVAKENNLPVPTEELSRLGKKAYEVSTREELRYAQEILDSPHYTPLASAYDAGFHLRVAYQSARRAGIDISKEASKLSEQIRLRKTQVTD